MKLSKPQKNLPGALAFSLALWIGLLPFFSALHLAMVLHVYCPEHRHLHDVVTAGEVVPTENTGRAATSLFTQSSNSSLTTLEECPFADLALRHGVVSCPSTLPNLLNARTRTIVPPPSLGASWPVLSQAPKHSPPFPAA